LVQVLQAIADHRPSEAPLAAGVRYTENGQALKPGDGMWGTATAVAMPGDGLSALGPSMSSYKLFLADPATGQAACLCSVNENGTPGIMAIRIKAAAGKVTEIESVAVREESTGPRGGTVTLFRTAPLAEFSAKGFVTPDPALTAKLVQRNAPKTVAIDVGRYFDTLAWNLRGSQPMAIEGSSRLNGRPLDATIPPSDVRGRRTALIDEDSGLALAFAVLDHDGPPRSNLLAAVFRVDGGKITRVEAIERPAPYGMTTGWGE
jgi:hypothetical protein